MTTAISNHLRLEALGILEGRSAILDLARELSGLMKGAEVRGAIIGGVAVVLHGHVRATRDIDLFAGDSADALAGLLLASDFRFDPTRREFVRDEIPVRLVTIQQVRKPPRKLVEIDGVTTISLEDLIEMKLRSGSANVLRAQDLADVIGLIRRHRLSSDFARLLEEELRPEYSSLIKELKREAEGGT